MAYATFTHSYGGTNRKFELWVNNKADSVNVANNTSGVDWSSTISGGGGTYFDSGCKITINGTVVYNETKYWSAGSYPAKDGTISGSLNDIPHNADGTKTIDFKIEGYSNEYTWHSATGSLTLTEVPRASTPSTSPTEATLNTTAPTITINTNTASNSFTHTITIKNGNDVVETIQTKGTNKSPTWSPAIATYAPLFTSGTSKEFTIECITYNGDTELGTKTCSIILKLPSSVKPTAKMTIVRDPDTSFPSGTKWDDVWVQNKSKLKVTITGEPSYSTDPTFIPYHEGTVDGVTYYGANMTISGNYQKYFISEFLANAGTITVSSKVIDSRGVSSNTVSKTLTVYPYSSPSITGSCTRCDGNSNPDDDGEYLYYNISGVISSINNKNSKTIRVKWKEKSSPSYPSGNVATLSTSSTPYLYSLSGRLTSTTFATDKSYDILFEVQDSFETTPMQRSLNTGFDLMNFNVSGKSMAIGKMSEANATDQKLEIGLDAYFIKDIYLKGTKIFWSS